MRSIDLAVIGAGPAGAVAARLAAQAGLNVWLIEKASLPRRKVCGGCLNAQACALLERIGLSIHQLDAMPVHTMQLALGSTQVSVPLEPGMAIDRAQLDDALARHAVDAGALLRNAIAATWQGATDHGHVLRLHPRNAQAMDVRAHVIIAADGIAGSFARQVPGLELRIARKSRIGIGTILEGAGASVPEGVIQMACGRAGYLGMARLPGDRVDVAMAVDAHAVRQAGGPARLAERLCAQADWPLPGDFTHGTWRGTATLTRHRKAGIKRMLVAGDAAGYVEPFTGQGIHWALTTGAAAAAHAVAGVRNWPDRHTLHWIQHHQQAIARAQRRCGRLACLLRYPTVARLVVLAAQRTRTLTHAVRYFSRTHSGSTLHSRMLHYF